MSCRECRELIAPFLMKELSAEQAAFVEQHVSVCVHCTQSLVNERALQSALAEHCAIPEPTPDYEARVLGAVRAHAASASGHSGWSTSMVGGAIAAALALGVALGVGMTADTGQSQPAMASSQATPASPSTAAYEPTLQTVRLAFNSGQPLENVTLTLELPANVELATFPGRQQLSWQVDLEQGENILALPLKVLFPGAGELIAHIDAGERQKTFRTAIPGQAGADKMEPAS